MNRFYLKVITQIFLYGNRNYNLTINRLMINSMTESIVSTERLECSLFNEKCLLTRPSLKDNFVNIAHQFCFSFCCRCLFLWFFLIQVSQ